MLLVLFGAFFTNTFFLPFAVKFCFVLLGDVFAVGLGEVDLACVEVGVAIAN
jgi:hypothetical protein